MVYNRHFFSMKKALFALIIAFPMIFSGCSKDDNSNSGGSPTSIGFEKLNTWIGASEASVASELQQMGFTADNSYDKNGNTSYTYMDEAAMVYIMCNIITDDNNTVRGTSFMQMSLATSYNGTLSTFQHHVQQERQLFGNPVQSQGEIDWDDTDDEDSAIDGSESYGNYDTFSSAAATMGSHRYVQLGWSDLYQNKVAGVAASYDNMHSSAYGASQMVAISLTDNSYFQR